MAELAHVLRHIVPSGDPRVLVDASTSDDAAVFLLDDRRALVTSVDFFTPVVDEPRDFGRIAAANALSDLYAMGATPLFALNVLGFPRSRLDDGALEEIVRGAVEKASEAGIPVLGGHSIDDPEPKFGMVVVGEVFVDRVVTNAGAEPGDHLVLTKPLGSGILSTAIKAGAASAEAVSAGVACMSALNAEPARAMVEAGVRAATDVTGYGLLGHLWNLLRASGAAARIDSAAVPLLPTVLSLAEAGHVPGGAGRNASDLEGTVHFSDGVSTDLRTLLVDPQTSGGLLIAVPDGALADFMEGLRGSVPAVAAVGRVTDGDPGSMVVD